MSRTKKDIQDTNEMLARVQRLGITYEDALALRRIAMTLHRWFEYECGTGEGQTTYAIERDGDEPDSKPYMRIMRQTREGYSDRRYPIADKETGARKRLTKIMGKYPTLSTYIQGDPRGASLYILRPDDIRKGETPDSCYTNGVAVYQ